MKKLIILLLVYLLIMFAAYKYLTEKMANINTTGSSYLPSNSPKLPVYDVIYTEIEKPLYEAQIASVQDISVGEIETNEEEYSQDELNLIYAIVRQEAGPDYESALAVMSTITNRLNDSHWSWCGDTVLEQITYPGQYCYSIDDYWVKYLDGNVEDCVKQAVHDGLAGKTNHNYTCFRGYPVEGAEKIGLDNWYFYDN